MQQAAANSKASRMCVSTCHKPSRREHRSHAHCAAFLPHDHGHTSQSPSLSLPIGPGWVGHTSRYLDTFDQ